MSIDPTANLRLRGLKRNPHDIRPRKEQLGCRR
jgi:hypothetical protein